MYPVTVTHRDLIRKNRQSISIPPHNNMDAGFFNNRVDPTHKKMKKIAIQGAKGSYHAIAAHRYFEGEEIELICCATFEELFATLRSNKLTIGMLAIENTIAGSLLQNNELLRQSGAEVIGEYKLRISHCFACLPEEDWSNIIEVNSHPIALMQCRDFLQLHPLIKVVETEDTALSATRIKQNGLKGRAAICSRQAAEENGMKILQEGIESNKRNFTRFLVIADPSEASRLKQQRGRQANKANLVFTLSHTEGSLSQVLSVLSFYQINLTKIQSLPIIGREWEYQFYVDVAFSDYQKYQQALAAITPLTNEFKRLGEYEAEPSHV